jgi:glycosyltransferase involved in cell wall biosynthesis
VAHDLFISQSNNGIDAYMLVRTKRSNHPNIISIEPVFSTKQDLLSYAQKHFQWQDFFNLSAFELFESDFFADKNIVHLHNLHGNYFSPLILPALSNKSRVVWTLHDMHSITGHCAHSFDCERWRTGCGECPDLKSYPSIEKDSTDFIWGTKKKLYTKSVIDVVAVSNWLANKVKDSILSNQKLHVIHNGIDTSVFKPLSKSFLKEKYGIPAEKKVILFSANSGLSNPYKGGEYVLKVIQDYAQNDILFVNVGASSEKKEGNVWQIQFESDQNVMAEWYNVADIFLYPSLADNCPLVVLESMACGCPVLSFQTGGIPELVIHNKTGYLAKYKDYSDLKRGFEEMLNNLQSLNEMSEASIERVLNNFTLEQMTLKYKQLYCSILSRN